MFDEPKFISPLLRTLTQAWIFMLRSSLKMEKVDIVRKKYIKRFSRLMQEF